MVRVGDGYSWLFSLKNVGLIPTMNLLFYNQNLNVKLGTTTKVKKIVSDITEKDPEVSTN